MDAGDAVHKLAQDLSKGMVIKAVLVFDFIDPNGGRQLNFAVTEDMTVWDLDGMLNGVRKISQSRYTTGG